MAQRHIVSFNIKATAVQQRNIITGRGVHGNTAEQVSTAVTALCELLLSVYKCILDVSYRVRSTVNFMVCPSVSLWPSIGVYKEMDRFFLTIRYERLSLKFAGDFDLQPSDKSWFT
jgi:hypothetical protein